MPSEAVSPPVPPAAPGTEGFRSYFLNWHFALLLAVIVFFGAIRWRLLDMPLERDEGEYAYAGQLILQGIPPYQLAYNMKLPGTYAAYAAMLAAFGQTARGVHLGLLLVNTICVILLYLLTARRFGTLAGTIAAASYILLSTHQGVLGFAAHATHFIVLAMLAGLILVLRAEETRRTSFFFWSGLAFGVAFLMKQPGLLLGVFGFLYLAIRCRPENAAEWPLWAKKMGVFLLAGVLPFAPTCAWLYRAGVFGNFWFWTFSYASQYATTVPLRAGVGEFVGNFSYIVYYTWGLWVLALVGISTMFWNPAVRRHALFLFGLLIFSWAAVCPGLYFRQHYFILVLPVMSIFVALDVTSTIDLLKERGVAHWVLAVPGVVFAFFWGLAILENSDFYFKLTPVQACRLCYFPNPFPEAEPIADYLRQHTQPTDTIMVLGSEPEIYFLARRHSASGYIYTYSLMEEQSFWPTMQKQMVEEIESKRPAYMLFVNIRASWLARPGSPQARALGGWMDQYIPTAYDEVGMVELAQPESRFVWGDAAKNYHRPGLEVRILKRKD